MFHSGKCPSCKKPVSHVKVETTQFTAGSYERVMRASLISAPIVEPFSAWALIRLP